MPSPTSFLSRARLFLARALCFPSPGVGYAAEGNLDGSAPQFSSRVQIPHPTREDEASDGLHLGDSTVGNKTECVLITHIRATDVAVKLRRIPVGFYVAVKTEHGTRRTSNKPASVRKDVVEWEDEIGLPSDRSSRISLTVFASFELGPTLGDGEPLRKFEITVDELLDRHGQSEPIKFVEQSEGEIGSSCSSFEIKLQCRVYGRNEYTTTSDQPESEEMRRLVELTDEGHHALIRYREHQEQRDLDESIKYFEHARDRCPQSHRSRASVLFNLATVKLIHCRMNDVSPDLDVPINLYRDVLRLRPRGHPDHPFSLLSLGVALAARMQRQHDEADGTEGKSLFSQVLDVALEDSYAYHAAVLALGCTAKSEMDQPTELSQIIQNDLEDRGVQRLDAALQSIFHPDSCKNALLDHLGILFCVRFDCLGDLGDPERAISTLEVVVQFTSDDHPDKSLRLNTLGRLLFSRYQLSGGVTDLERSICFLADAVQLTSDGHPDKSSWLKNLGHLLLARYERFGDVTDLERSISLQGDAVQLISDGHPDKPFLLNNLGSLLSARYYRFGDIANLEKSISLFEDAVKFTPDGHPDKPSWLNNLGHSLSSRYDRFGDIADLEKSISLFADIVKFTPDGHPAKPSRLNNLSHSLSTRYERFGDIADLEKSISLFEDAVKFTPNGHTDKPLCLDSLGLALSTRYERFGDVTDLEGSISLREDALRLTPDGHPGKPLLLNGLGFSLSTRYERFGDVTDLERSTSLREDALRLTPDGHPAKPLRLNNLARSLHTRYERFGDIADLEKSISLFEDAVKFAPDEHPDKPSRLDNLGHSLSTRYERFGDITDLERSISLREDALQLTPDGHPGRPLRLNNLARSLSVRYERFGDVTDLERLTSLREDAVRLTPDGHPAKPLWLNNLGRSLSIRYEHFGDVSDLQKSISLLEDAVRLTADEHTDKPPLLDNLGHSLSSRYTRFGDVTDLERSISLREHALRLTPDGRPDKPSRLDNLARSLSIRYERFGDVIDLERSISLKEDAVQLTPDGHPDKPLRLNNLGDSLSSRYGRFEDVTDLEKSISLFEDAVQSTPDGHPGKPSLLSNLGLLLFTRFQRFGDIVDLQRSISLGEDAIQSTPDDHPDKSLRLNKLNLSLLQRILRSSDPSSSDLSKAISYASHAARSHTGPSAQRFHAAEFWIGYVRHGHDSQPLLDAYTVAVDLLPQLAWIGLSLHDRYHQLLRAADAACDAAAIALEVHKPALAVEWLEQGRSVVWSQFSQLRTPVDALKSVYPELATQFEHVSRELEHGSARDRAPIGELTADSNMKVGVLEKEARTYHEFALSRERLLAEIHALPGFERFLLPKTIKQLSSLAHAGPVVFLNANKQRCDALVVMAGSEDVIHVPLSNTNYDEVAGMQLRMNDLLRLKGRAMMHDDSDRGARVKGMTPDDVFSSILPYLWEKVVSPILEVLSLSKPGPKLPRIFWCPTGPFSFLPIHAAGLYDKTNPSPKLSDFAVSSYIPTMSALELPPQEHSEVTSRNIRLLVVPQPSTDGQSHLSGVRGEIESIRKSASSSPFVSFQEADGTVEDVSSKMMETDWVHFACHGTQDRTNPYDSGFLLAHGKRLKLPDIARLSRPHGGLAFLSACHTATGDAQLSEEAIHIAAGMLLVGYRGVIATMWSILDNDAPRVTDDVYKSLFSDGQVPDSRQAAEALHDAIERLRDSGASFLSWVPFIHVGL